MVALTVSQHCELVSDSAERADPLQAQFTPAVVQDEIGDGEVLEEGRWRTSAELP